MHQLLKNIHSIFILSVLSGTCCLVGAENKNVAVIPFTETINYYTGTIFEPYRITVKSDHNFIKKNGEIISFTNKIYVNYAFGCFPSIGIKVRENTEIIKNFGLYVTDGGVCFVDIVSNKSSLLKASTQNFIDTLKLSSVESKDPIDMGRLYSVGYMQQLMAEVIKNHVQNTYDLHNPDNAVFAHMCGQLDIILQEHKKIFDVYAVDKHKIEAMSKFLSKKATIQDLKEAFKKCEDSQKYFYPAPGLIE